MNQDHNIYMQEAIAEAGKCSGSGDVPIGAVIVRNGGIIARGRNRIEETGDPTSHAEIEAIRKAVGVTDYKHLLECTIYVTLEPCAMCAGAIVLARLPLVVFGAFDPKAGACASLYEIACDPRLNHRAEIIGGVLEEECSILLKIFFKKIRDKKKTDG